MPCGKAARKHQSVLRIGTGASSNANFHGSPENGSFVPPTSRRSSGDRCAGHEQPTSRPHCGVIFAAMRQEICCVQVQRNPAASATSSELTLLFEPLKCSSCATNCTELSFRTYSFIFGAGRRLARYLRQTLLASMGFSRKVHVVAKHPSRTSPIRSRREAHHV